MVARESWREPARPARGARRHAVRAVLCLWGLALPLAACGRAEGAELLFEANVPELPSEAVMDGTREAVARRIAELGVPGVRIEREGAKRILVRLDDRAHADAVRALIDRRGRLEFRLVDSEVRQRELEAGKATLSRQILSVRGQGEGARLAVERRAIVTGDMIVDAFPSFNPQGNPSVVIQLDAAGARRFARATSENVHRLFAIVIDDEVISAPLINEPILGDTAEIAGAFTVEETARLAAALRAGELPVDLEVVEERLTGGN